MHTGKLYIDGKILDGDAGTFEVRNPATDTVFGKAPISSAEQVNSAVCAAAHAQKKWAGLPDVERKEALLRIAEVLETHSDELARAITREQGKPLFGPGARLEVQACVKWTRATAALNLPVEVAFEDSTRRDEIHWKPLGVIGALTPWNWPLMIAIWQIIPGLRMGNTAVVKPSEFTPLCTLRMLQLIGEALPAGVLNSICGDGAVGQMLTRHPGVHKIMFTGSLSTGKKVVAASAETLARVTLELGGNDAAVVLESCDPKAIAEPLFWSAFANVGQTCACVKRLYVHENIYEQMVAELAAVAKRMPMGDGTQEGVVLGPMQNKKQFEIVSALVEDSKRRGARIVTGGDALKGQGYFFPITLVADIEDDSSLVKEEQFGPALPILKFKSEAEAIERANSLDAALGASVWSADSDAAMRVASQLEAGTVWINQHGAIHPMVPFGGAKGSGYGLEFGIEGLKAVSQPKVISIKK